VEREATTNPETRVGTSLLAVLLGGLAATMLGCYAQQPQPYTPPSVYTPPPVVYVPPPPPPAPTHNVRASYYGDSLAGHVTKNGETYDPEELTAASKTLPLGSYARVTNPANGKSVVVRINDRGPHIRGRSLDLSKRAATELGLTHKGVARLKIASLGKRPRDLENGPIPAPPTAVAGSATTTAGTGAASASTSNVAGAAGAISAAAGASAVSGSSPGATK
jgi:rare lipoprotein A